MPCGGTPAAMPAPERRWLSVEGLADYLGCSRRSAERFLDKTGVLKVRITGGRRVVVDRRAVDSALEALQGEQMYDQPAWKRELSERLAKYKAARASEADHGGPPEVTPEAGEGKAESVSGDFFELEAVETEEMQ